MSRYTGKQDGLTFILVIMVTTVLFVIISALGAISCKSYINITSEENFLQAYYAAEAGIEKNLAAIKAGVPIPLATELNDGVKNTVEVNEQQRDKHDIGCLLLINSLGKCEGKDGSLLAQKTLQCMIAKYTTPDYFKGLTVLSDQPAPFEFDGRLELTRRSLVHNGDILLKPESIQVNGDIWSSGEVIGSNDNNKGIGQIYANYDYVPPFPELDKGYYLKRATDYGQVFNTDVYFDNSPHADVDITDCNGFYYVDGDVTIAGVYGGKALIFSTGVINVVGDLMPVSVLEHDLDVIEESLTLVSLANVVVNYPDTIERIDFNDVDDDCVVYANIMAKDFLVIQHDVQLCGAACVGENLVNDASETDDVIKFEVCEVNGLEPLEGAIEVQIQRIFWIEMYPVF